MILKKKFLPSLTFDADSLSVPKIRCFDLVPGQPEPLRVSNHRADVIQGHVDEVSGVGEEKSEYPSSLTPLLVR